MFDFSILKRSVQDLGNKTRELRGQIERAKREREDIANAPPAKADVQAMLERWIADTRSDYLKKLVYTLDVAFKKVDRLTDTAYVNNRVSLVGATGQIDGLMSGVRAIDGALCALLGDQLIDAMGKALSDWPKGGLPLAERAKAVKKLDAQIRDLEAQEAELLMTAKGAGIVIDQEA